jgi:hypothetical protein
MKKISPALVLAASLSAIAIPAAYAHDYDSDSRSEWNDIQRDRAPIASDARKVQDERDELASVRRHQQWSLWYGDYRSADRASEQAREEEAELRAAQQKLNHDVSDIQRDRAELYQDEPHRWHWWVRRWFGGDNND